MAAVVPEYGNLVFINCPFDKEYTPILYAIIYTIYRCGFYPLTALAEDDASDFRLDKIIRFIERCKYGVHDISRTKLNQNGFPRFNMPFELGVFFGAKRFGGNEHKAKIALVFEKTKYSYLQCISDLNGIDTKAHNDDPMAAIKNVRDWLSTNSKRTGLPSYRTIQNEYVQFQAQLGKMAAKTGFDIDEIHFTDFCAIVEERISKLPGMQKLQLEIN